MSHTTEAILANTWGSHCPTCRKERLEAIREHHEAAKPYPAFTGTLGQDMEWLLSEIDRLTAELEGDHEP